MTPDPLIVYAVFILLFLPFAACNLLTFADEQDARNAVQAEAQQKRWLAK